MRKLLFRMRVAVPCGALCLMALAPAPVAGQGRSAAVAHVDVRLLDLTAVRRLVHALPQRPAASEGARAGGWLEVSSLADAIVGHAGAVRFSADDLMPHNAADRGPRVSAAPGVEARDAAAYRLLALGYSPRETADIVSGRIGQDAIDTARKMLAVGRGPDVAADFLDTQYQRVSEWRHARRDLAPRRPSLPAGKFDGLINALAHVHRVDANVVRAIVATESGFNPLARSPKGAIGLMQLMPGTARELGVNPFIPEQNLEGGVRYFASMLKMFGRLDLALVAYNAGPGFAQRYARGQAALYGETRDYVRKVLGRIGGAR